MDRAVQHTHAATHPLRVYVVEDSERIVRHLAAMLGAMDGVRMVGNAADVDEALSGIAAEHPDVVLLDIQLAKSSGFDLLRTLGLRAPEVDVYMFSNFADEPYRRLAEKLGARGFFDKSTEFDEMRQTLAARARNTH